jgi:predicted metal-binding membrane protein
MSRVTAATSTLGLAGASWIVAVHEMKGMDMGVSTELGSFGLFLAVWLSVMAAMMLPGALPAVLRNARVEDRILAVPLFAGSYLAVWAVVGLAIYSVYEPHGTSAAGVIVIGAGLYELTPLKLDCRRRCRGRVRSGFEFGLYCVGSSIGLMVVLIALGVMSVTWMALIAALIIAQKLLPPRASIDVPLALAIVGLGALIVLAPGAVPGLTRAPM